MKQCTFVEKASESHMTEMRIYLDVANLPNLNLLFIITWLFI